jgi:hypothetical protein
MIREMGRPCPRCFLYAHASVIRQPTPSEAFVAVARRVLAASNRLLLTQHHMARVEAIGDVAEPGPAIRHRHVRIHLLVFSHSRLRTGGIASPLPAPWQYDQRGLRTGCADGTDEIGSELPFFGTEDFPGCSRLDSDEVARM